MSLIPNLALQFYKLLLACYPATFRNEFGAEMAWAFRSTMMAAQHKGQVEVLRCLGREIRDWPTAVWQAYCHQVRGCMMNNNSTTVSPQLTVKELLVAMMLFVFPILAAGSVFLFNYHPEGILMRAIFILTTLAFLLIVLVWAGRQGFPRWAVPFLGMITTAIVMLEPAWRLWELFYQPVQSAIAYHTKTLQVRVLYSTLRVGFAWFSVFVAFILLILLLAIWPRTRRLARSIRQDWTVFSFLLYGGAIIAIEVVFEEYIQDEGWKIACWASLALGAWIYLKSSNPRKRILALLMGVTLAYWIAAVGKWFLVPIQTWGAFHGYQYETYKRFEFWRTLGEWGWVLLFLLLPALSTKIPERQDATAHPDDQPTLA